VELWLVRHGESTWNSERRFQGSQDAPLSERGREQAVAVGRALGRHSFAALYTSPLGRARDTAAACADALGLAATPVGDLREMCLGDWEGSTVETVVERYGDHYWRWLTGPADHPPPAGEPVERFQGRVAAAVGELAARHPAGSVLAVTHGGVIAGLLCRWLALGPNALWRLRIENTSVTRVSLPAGHVCALNDTRHLAGIAAPAAATAP
jgi:probable phosphoglycerate mutase